MIFVTKVYQCLYESMRECSSGKCICMYVTVYRYYITMSASSSSSSSSSSLLQARAMNMSCVDINQVYLQSTTIMQLISDLLTSEYKRRCEECHTNHQQFIQLLKEMRFRLHPDKCPSINEQDKLRYGELFKIFNTVMQMVENDPYIDAHTNLQFTYNDDDNDDCWHRGTKRRREDDGSDEETEDDRYNNNNK